MRTVVDVAGNRRARKWTRKELAGRALWAVVSILFVCSPRLLWGWRRMLLRMLGARVGRGVHLYPSVKIALPWNIHIGDYTAIGDGVRLYSLGLISVGERVTISQGAHICAGTHDHRKPDLPLLKMPIVIESDTWICADAFIGPGVRIGRSAIVGARSVVMKSVAENLIVAGNPSRSIGSRNS